MNTVSRISFLLLAAAAAAQNQTVIFPRDQANIANGGSYNYQMPFSYGVSRIQTVYDAWDIGVPVGHQINGIGFRQDGSNASTGHALQLEVRIGTTTYTANTITGTFDSNYQTPLTTVFGPAIFNLPNLSSASSGQQFFVNFTTPWTYTGGNLLVEYRITANNNGNQPFTYYLDAADFVSVIENGVQGCPNSGGQRATLTSQPTRIGGSWSLYLGQGPASTTGFLLMQLNTPLQTPFSLQPYVPGIDPSCNGQLSLANPIFTVPFGTDTSGNHSWYIPVPDQRLRWYQAAISTQAAMIDVFAPGSFVVSSANRVSFGILPANSFVYASGSAGATNGSVWANSGIITFFQYQ